MQDDEEPFIQEHWRFQRDYFKEIPYHTLELSHYKTMVQKLGRMLYPQEIENVELMELSAPLIRMKIRHSGKTGRQATQKWVGQDTWLTPRSSIARKLWRGSLSGGKNGSRRS